MNTTAASWPPTETHFGVQAQPGGMPDHHLESLLVSSLQHVHVFRPQFVTQPVLPEERGGTVDGDHL
jgi:hypothetical protein